MAKVQMPLLSGTASGSIAPGLTFSLRRSGQQVRVQRRQKDKQTPARSAQRARFLLARDAWSGTEYGVAEYGVTMLGGRQADITSLPRGDRAPQFARFVGDWLKIF